MNKLAGRLLALLLIVGILLSAVSCGKQKDKTEADILPQRLVVEEATVSYTASQRFDIATQAVSLIKRYLSLLSPEQAMTMGTQLYLRSFLAEQILPIMEQNQMTEQELQALFSLAETYYASLADSQNRELPHMVQLCTEAYRRTVSVVGIRRAGGIGFDFASLYLDQCIADYTYRSSENLTDEDRAELLSLQQLKQDMHAGLGKELFADMLGFIVFSGGMFGEVLRDAPMLGGSGIAFHDEELLLLLQKQAAYLDPRSITVTQWQIAFRLLSRIFSEQIISEALKPLANEKTACALGAVMPSVAILYEKLVDSVTVERIAALRHAEGAEIASVLCDLILSCRDELDQVRQLTEEALASADRAVADQLITMGAEERFEAWYAEILVADAASLWQAIGQMSASANAESWDALLETVLAYGRGVLPHVIFTATQWGEDG